MAINLNPGADATLVNAAYRAASGTAPKDYSRTLERAADSYEKTMQAQTKTLGSIAALGAAIGGEMVANANELSAMAAEGAGLDAEGAKVLIEELYANKDAQKELRGINFLQSRETRQKRQALKLEQRELFANIKTATESIRLGSEAVAAGTFKVLRGNETEAEMVNAIIKSNLKDKATGNKNIARLGRDEKTGELMYTMYNTESDPNGVSYDPPRTMTIRQFNKAITTNVDDKGVMKGKLNTVNGASAKAGNASLNGVYDPEMKQMHLNQLDDIVKTDTDLQRAFGEKFGYSNSSFIEDIQRPSNLSTWVYNDLLSVTGAKDELALGGLTEGIEDTDNSGGISQAELQNDTNYGILAENILGLKDTEVSKALFKEYTIDKFEAAHKYGYSKKPPVAGKTDGTSDDKDIKYGGFGQFRVKTGGGGNKPVSITSATALQRRNYLNDFGQIDGEHGQYIWNKDLGDNGMYVRDDGKNMSMFEVARDEGLIKPGEGKGDFNPTRNAAANEENKNLNKGLASPSMLQSAGSMGSQDNAAANKLNNTFKFTSAKDSDYFFVPYSDAYGEIVDADNVFSNDIMLIDGSTGKPIRDGKKVRRFGTGKDYSANDLKWINDFLGEYASKQQQADDTTTYTQN